MKEVSWEVAQSEEKLSGKKYIFLHIIWMVVEDKAIEDKTL